MKPIRLALLVATLAGLPAQALDPARAIAQYAHRSWRPVDGLPSANVRAIAQTPDGFLWVGSRGLARFDGGEFKNAEPWSAVGKDGDTVLCLYVDRVGALWIGTEAGRVHRLRDRTLDSWVLGSEPEPRVMPVKAFAEQSDGTLFVSVLAGSGSSEIYRFEESGFRRFDDRFPQPLGHVPSLHVDGDDALWLGAVGAVHRWNGTQLRTWELDAPTLAVLSMMGDRDGALWVATGDGLFRVQDGLLERAPFAHAALQKISDVLRDRAGNLWIATSGGLLRVDPAGSITRYSAADGLSHDNVFAVLEDRDGSLWAATESGIDRFVDGPLVPLGTQEGLSHRLAWSILEDRAGRMWIGTGAGVDRLEDGRVVATYGRREGLSGQVLALHEDRAGNLWLGTRGGLDQFRNDRVVASWRTARELATDSLRAVLEDRDGNLWLGGENGLPRLVDGRIVPARPEQSGAYAILEDRRGAVWFGTLTGLVRFEGGQWTRFTRRDGLAHDMVFSLYAAADGALWIGTYGGGLSRFLDGRFTNYSTQVGLINDVIHQVIEDDSGNLWMCSDHGIFFVRLDELNAYAEGRLERVAAIGYDTRDGMRNAECNGGSTPGSWKGADGRLWFATLDGIVIVDPARRVTTPPPLFIDEVRVDGVRRVAATALVIPPGRGEFDVHYVAVALAQPHRVRYRYRLEPYDDHWIEAGASRSAHYTSLPPGAYRFAVTAAIDEGGWNTSAAEFGFRLRPHFHQTRTFYGLCLAGLVGVGFVGYRTRVRQLDRRARELGLQVAARTRDLAEQRDRTEEALREARAQHERAEKALAAVREIERLKSLFFANVSHEFRTPLTLTIGPLENALAGAYGETGPPLRRNLQLMLRHSRRLLRLINQLLDLSKLEAGQMALRAERRDAARFIEALVRSFDSLAERKHIALRFECAEEDLESWFDPEKIEKVVFNLLSNAFKFTPEGGEISVAVYPRRAVGEREELAIVVRDNGRGIPADALPHIFDRFHQVDATSTREHEGTGIGLSLVRELVELHRGTIDVSCRPGQGSEFVVRLPRGPEHLAQHERVEVGGDEASAASRERQATLELAALEPERTFDLAGDAELPGCGTLPGKPATLLIVDDNPDLRRYVRDSLGGPHSFIEAADGEAGLRQAREHLPDLIISDVMMPRLDGFELCRQLRADPVLAHIPVILLTARATEELRVEGLEVGADDYVSKPFNARELAARAGNLIRLHRQERELVAFNVELERRVREQLETILRGKRLTRYFSPSLVDWILEAEDELRISGERRRVTMLFSDLAGFTGLSLGLSPDRLADMLNEYLTAMADVIAAHGGALDKFMGDGILALFGAPTPMAPQDQARNAVRTALAMHRRLAELEQAWSRHGLTTPLAIRVGIHQDEVTVGNFGSERYLQFTAIGPGVNLASRLQEACVAGRILVSSAIHELAGDEFEFRALGRRPLRGIPDVTVYDLSPI